MSVSSDRTNPSRYPRWVRLATWRVPGRRGLWLEGAVCALIAIVALVYSFSTPYLFVQVLAWQFAAWAMVGAFWAWLAMRWIDRYGSWDTNGRLRDGPEWPRPGHDGRSSVILMALSIAVAVVATLAALLVDAWLLGWI